MFVNLGKSSLLPFDTGISNCSLTSSQHGLYVLLGYYWWVSNNWSTRAGSNISTKV